MLLIVRPGRIGKVEAVFAKHGVQCSVIGKVTADRILRVKDRRKVVAEVPAEALAVGPEYTREKKRARY